MTDVNMRIGEVKDGRVRVTFFCLDCEKDYDIFYLKGWLVMAKKGFQRKRCPSCAKERARIRNKVVYAEKVEARKVDFESKCFFCEDEEKRYLVRHHVSYGVYDTITLCKSCHYKLHSITNEPSIKEVE